MLQAFAILRWLINKPIITTMIPPHCCIFNFSESNIHENIAVKTGMRFTKICARATPITLTESANMTKAITDAKMVNNSNACTDANEMLIC